MFWHSPKLVTPNLDSIFRVHARTGRPSACGPERFQVDCSRGEDRYLIALIGEVPTQAGEVCLRSAQRGRVALDEMGDAQTRLFPAVHHASLPSVGRAPKLGGKRIAKPR